MEGKPDNRTNCHEVDVGGIVGGVAVVGELGHICTNAVRDGIGVGGRSVQIVGTAVGGIGEAGMGDHIGVEGIINHTVVVL